MQVWGCPRGWVLPPPMPLYKPWVGLPEWLPPFSPFNIHYFVSGEVFPSPPSHSLPSTRLLPSMSPYSALRVVVPDMAAEPEVDIPAIPCCRVHADPPPIIDIIFFGVTDWFSENGK